MKERIASLDTLKSFSILAVICIHTLPFYGPSFSARFYKVLFYLINSGTRFAVPFFFAVSGYLYGRSLAEGLRPVSLLGRYWKRLLTVFLIWTFVYSFIPSNWVEQLAYHEAWKLVWWKLRGTYYFIREEPVTFLMQGTSQPLWFLTALLLSLSVLTLFIILRIERYFVLAGTFLYGWALMASAYSKTPVGFYFPAGLFEAIEGPFRGMLFVALGFEFSRRPLIGKSWIPVLILGGYFLQLAEAFCLWKYFGVRPYHNFLIGTVFFGTGFLVLALTYPALGERSVLSSWGQKTLGIYVTHALIAETLVISKSWMPPVMGQIAFPLIVYFASLLFVSILSRYRLTRAAVFSAQGQKPDQAAQRLH
ncbi:MAG TPA: acyltransferase [bacterium]|nr:acyltransferase [bacterium]